MIGLEIPASSRLSLNAPSVSSLSTASILSLSANDNFAARGMMGSVNLEFDGDNDVADTQGGLLPTASENLRAIARQAPLSYLCRLDNLTYFQAVAELADRFVVTDGEIGCSDETRFSELVSLEIEQCIALATTLGHHPLVISERVTALKNYFGVE